MSPIFLIQASDLEAFERDPTEFFLQQSIDREGHESRQEAEFHLVMRQFLMEIPGCEHFLRRNPVLQKQVLRAIAIAETHRVNLFATNNPNQPVRRLHEQIWVGIGEVLISHTYDLILHCEQSANMIDWTTNAIDNQPLSVFALGKSWKTRLARFLFAESGGCEPDSITLSIWSVHDDSPGTVVTLSWDAEQHEKMRTDLEQTFGKMKNPEKAVSKPDNRASAAEYRIKLDEIPEISVCRREPQE